MIVHETLFPGITYASMTAEAERELASRRRLYPDRVAHGRMKPEEAEYQIDIMAAIAADTVCMGIFGLAVPMPCLHRFSWTDRRRAIERELDMRDRFYPQWIASLRMTQANADRQMAAMKAILWRYDCGFDWIGAPLTGTERRSAWLSHWETIEPRWYASEPAQALCIAALSARKDG